MNEFWYINAIDYVIKKHFDRLKLGSAIQDSTLVHLCFASSHFFRSSKNKEIKPVSFESIGTMLVLINRRLSLIEEMDELIRDARKIIFISLVLSEKICFKDIYHLADYDCRVGQLYRSDYRLAELRAFEKDMLEKLDFKLHVSVNHIHELLIEIFGVHRVGSILKYYGIQVEAGKEAITQHSAIKDISYKLSNQSGQSFTVDALPRMRELLSEVSRRFSEEEQSENIWLKQALFYVDINDYLTCKYGFQLIVNAISEVFDALLNKVGFILSLPDKLKIFSNYRKVYRINQLGIGSIELLVDLFYRSAKETLRSFAHIEFSQIDWINLDNKYLIPESAVLLLPSNEFEYDLPDAYVFVGLMFINSCESGMGHFRYSILTLLSQKDESLSVITVNYFRECLYILDFYAAFKRDMPLVDFCFMRWSRFVGFIQSIKSIEQLFDMFKIINVVVSKEAKSIHNDRLQADLLDACKETAISIRSSKGGFSEEQGRMYYIIAPLSPFACALMNHSICNQFRQGGQSDDDFYAGLSDGSPECSFSGFTGYSSDGSI